MMDVKDQEKTEAKESYTRTVDRWGRFTLAEESSGRNVEKNLEHI